MSRTTSARGSHRSSKVRRTLTATAVVLGLAGITPLAAAGSATATAAPAASPAAAPADPVNPMAYPFRDPSLPLAVRVSDLLHRLTLPEKIGLMHQYEQPIPRLGIALFKAGTEALHGVAWSNDANDNGNVVTATATVFPQAIGMASTWDPALVKKIGAAVGDEARGLHAQNPTVWGLDLWAPVVNLLRDPRWGRNEEGYSEDPTLTGTISTAYGSGIEGPDLAHLQAAPTLKHFLAYNNEVDRTATSSNLTPRVLNEYDEQAFKPAITANAATGVMPSYNLVNGRPNTVSPLLNEIRSWTTQKLFNVSDAGAPLNLTSPQENYYATQPAADAAMYKAGMDSYTADNQNPQPLTDAINAALTQGLLTVEDVEKADTDALTIRFRLGEFDPNGGKYGAVTAADVNTPAHQQLARQAADEAAVLLKNSQHTLPLSAAKTKRVAVLGPLENTLYTDWYSGQPPYKVTPLQGIQQRLGAGATVTGNEGTDRIALQDVATGMYVASTGTTDTTPVMANDATPDAAAQFDAFDWGQGTLTLRNAANSKVVGSGGGGFITKDDQPNGWFVQQQFKLELQPDGTYILHYAGYETTESWFSGGTYVTVGADGKLVLGATTAAGATHFAKTVVSSGIDTAVAAAKAADTAIVVVGSMPFINGREAHDRTTMALPDSQEKLIEAVRKANPHTIVVLETSYPDTITWAQQHVKAILWTTHAGQETGHAIADILFGDYNPSGRLTQTWYRSDQGLPSILDYDIIKSNRTYLYYKGKPLYPFGYGLSYTSFDYSNLTTSATSVGSSGKLDVSVRVTNSGTRAGNDVVQLYTRQRTSRDKEPLKSLRGSQFVHLGAGQSKVVHLSLNLADLAHWDVTRSKWVVESSKYDVMVGQSSADIAVSAAITVHGETIPPRNLTVTTQAQNFDNYSGAALVDTSKTDGTSVGSSAAGDWVEYSHVALDHPATFSARVANPAASDGTIEVHLNSSTGPLVATAVVPSTGDKYSYTDVAAVVSGATGVHNVYLVLSAGIRLDTFTLG